MYESVPTFMPHATIRNATPLLQYFAYCAFIHVKAKVQGYVVKVEMSDRLQSSAVLYPETHLRYVMSKIPYEHPELVSSP
jgi:hypothetical protein